MATTFADRLQHSWNAFRNYDATQSYRNYGPSSSSRPDRKRYLRGSNKSIALSVFNKIAVDCAGIKMNHCKVDTNGRYVETIDSGLNNILTIEANIDQTARAFILDIVMSMLDEGVVALVPTETNVNPINTGGFDITSMRTGKITQWYPKHVEIDVYDEDTGRHKRIVMPKSKVAIIENPLCSSLNDAGSVFQRLLRKMALLDAVDEESGSGKLDLIVQLPYAIKNEARRKQAEKRRADLEDQLHNSKYGVAYTDATEHVTQLNRSLENNLMKQIEYLTEMFYNQLGLSQNVFNGSADEAEMLNYYSRTIEPIMAAIADEIKRKFLTKTARTQGQSIMFFRDPFKLIPVDKIADIADKFTRNAILSSNELRAIVGYKPVNDERADQLSNKNLNESPDAAPPPSTNEEVNNENGQSGNKAAILAMPLSQIGNNIGSNNTEQSR